MQQKVNELCTRVHTALRDAGLLGVVSGQALVYADARQGVRITVDFPEPIIEQLEHLDAAR